MSRKTGNTKVRTYCAVVSTWHTSEYAKKKNSRQFKRQGRRKMKIKKFLACQNENKSNIRVQHGRTKQIPGDASQQCLLVPTPIRTMVGRRGGGTSLPCSILSPFSPLSPGSTIDGFLYYNMACYLDILTIESTGEILARSVSRPGQSVEHYCQ